MEIAQCRYFLALCQEGNFTRAAKRCGVAQPSLTRAISKLERELGKRLFVRRPDRSKLTPFGWEVFPYFDEIARCVAEIKHRPQRMSATDRKADGVPSTKTLAGDQTPLTNNNYRSTNKEFTSAFGR